MGDDKERAADVGGVDEAVVADVSLVCGGSRAWMKTQVRARRPVATVLLYNEQGSPVSGTDTSNMIPVEPIYPS